MKPKYWFGSAPVLCDLCGRVFFKAFVDGITRMGWARMCLDCHAANGQGLGTGQGQKYERQPDGRWLKVAG